MATRPILSRPRTRVYDANYNIGESYYKSAIDRLDRKYSGRPLSPPRNLSLPRDIMERHERAFADEDLSTARLRAEKHITEPTLFDTRGSRAAARALEALEGDLNEETATALKRIRASKKVSVIDDLGMENTVSSVTARRIKERSDKLLDTVGLNEFNARKALEEDSSLKRRSLRVSYDDNVDSNELTKWSPIADEESGASLRVKQSRARLNELEEEMNSMAERQAARERRAARLKAMVADFDDDNDVAAVQSVRISRKERIVEEI